MNKYDIINITDEEIDLSWANSYIDFILKEENLSNVIFNIIMVDLDYIQNLNNTYRNKDSITDVITFALEDEASKIDDNIRLLGDIYICLDKAREQSIEYGHSLKREIAFLMTHGVLHLLGYDHMNDEDEKIMFAKQEVLLNGYKITREETL